MTDDGTVARAREALLRELLAEQSLPGAIIGGLVAALCAVALWLGLTIAFEGPLRLPAAFSGVVVGFGLRNWGRGFERRFAVIGALFTFLALLFGSVLAGAAQVSMRHRLDFWPFLAEFLNLSYAFNLATENLRQGGFLFWVIGLVLGWRLSYRKIGRERLARIRASE